MHDKLIARVGRNFLASELLSYCPVSIAHFLQQFIHPGSLP